MKRLSLIKKIGLGLGSAAAIAPIAVMLSSCAVTSITVDTIKITDFVSEDGKAYFSKAKHLNLAFKDLLYGSKGVYSGNYILLVGTNMISSTCNFFSGQDTTGTRDDWYNVNIEESIFFKGVANVAADVRKELVENVGFYNIIDFFDFKIYDNTKHELAISTDGKLKTEQINPYMKWTEQTINTTYDYNHSILHYEWDKESVEDGDYIRNDASAVAYRAFNDYGAALYPEDKDKKREVTFDTTGNSSRMAVFKEGKLITITDIPNSPENWEKVIRDNFKIEEEK